MVWSLFLAVALFGLSGLVHLRAMNLVMRFGDSPGLSGSGRVLVALYTLGIAHVVEAGLYAVGFSMGEALGIGGFEQDIVDSFMDVF